MKFKYIMPLLLVLGIVHRFIFQFISPVFNADEISLGNNLKHLSFSELLYPLNDFQSAPPLYLILQKVLLTILPTDFWIKIKLLSFAVSIGSLIYFYRFVKKEHSLISLLLLIMFAFNPYVIYNTLTLKQYGFDLLGIIILISYYKSAVFPKYAWLFFMIWCLLSNIGLFACAGYLIYLYFDIYKEINFKFISQFIKAKLLIFLAPIPYIFYFIWYMQQEGAKEMRFYMTEYWREAFIPLNASFFKHIIRIAHELWICFYSAYEIWGIFLMLFLIPLIYHLIKGKNLLWKKEITMLCLILLVHVLLNILKLYPLSDRLFLYLTPLFLLSLGSSLNIITNQLPKYKIATLSLIILITSVTYITYLSYKNNDVPHLNKYLESLNNENPVLLTGRVEQSLIVFNDFTDDSFGPITNYEVLSDNNLNQYNYLVSKVHTKMKPGAFSSEDVRVKGYLDENKIILVKNIPGYNIYKIKD